MHAGFTNEEHTKMDYYYNALGRGCVLWGDDPILNEELAKKELKAIMQDQSHALIDQEFMINPDYVDWK
jgi:hypothetical protein